jgi:flavin-binding protein dodecin
MSSADHVYKTVEVTGSSTAGIDGAIRTAVRHLEWFEVLSVRGHIEHGQVGHFQVTLKLGFGLE